MTEARSGKAYFQWNAGRWFSFQIGSALWILLLGYLYLSWSIEIGTCVILCFVMIQVFSTLLWLRRSRLAPYPAIQVMVFFSGFFAMIALILIDLSGGFKELYRSSPISLYAILLVYPIIMKRFHSLERRAEDNVL